MLISQSLRRQRTVAALATTTKVAATRVTGWATRRGVATTRASLWGVVGQPAPTGSGPTSPPIMFSGADAGLLAGPSSAPAGAVTVSPSTHIDSATSANPAGTTFYLTAGTHTLSSAGQFAQVQPKAGNTYIGAPGAILSGQNGNAYAFTGSAANVTIKYLEITGFTCGFDEFVVNHDTASGWTISYCNIHGNGGGSVGIGSNMTLTYCWLHNNVQYGFSSYVAPVNGAAGNALSNVLVDHCEVSFNGSIADEWNADNTPTGNGRNGGCKFWDTLGITVTNCYVHHNNGVGLWADTNNVDFTCRGNWISESTAGGIMYEISYSFCIENNTLVNNSIYAATRIGDNFPRAAIYISESGGDSAVSSVYPTSFIRNNTFTNNWDDIALWESADRFCNSPANTSSKIYKPKGHGATLAACNQPTSKVLTVTLTSGSPLFTVTSGTLESTDEGRPCSGSGIPGGAQIQEPVNNSTPAGFIDPTHGRMSANASASGSVTMTLAAGTINADPAFSACRWHTQNVSVTGNVHNHNRSAVLAQGWNGTYTLPNGVTTGKIAVLSQYGTYPSWSPYQAFTVADAISQTQNNLWANNAYSGSGTYSFIYGSTAKTYSQWRATGQDSGSTYS